MGKGAGSFATFMILCPVSFFLGMLFSSFPYDHPLLWTSSLPGEPFYTMLEQHLRHMHAAPPLIPRILHIVIAVGLIGFFIKLYKPSESNMLFDGASLVLYVIAIAMYVTNIVKGLRIVTAGTYGVELVEGENTIGQKAGEEVGVGRVDSLRVLAASNTILALVLMGVLVLQAGQWYAERKEGEEAEQYRKESEEKAKSAHKSPTGKKRQ